MSYGFGSSGERYRHCLHFPANSCLSRAHCTKAQRAVVISNRNFIRALGGSIGLAIFATTMRKNLQELAPVQFVAFSQMAYHTPDLNKIGATAAQKQETLHAYAKASRSVFIMNTPFIGLCLLGCVIIKNRRLQRPDELDTTRLTANLSDQTIAPGVEMQPTNLNALIIAEGNVTKSRTSSSRKQSRETENEKERAMT